MSNDTIESTSISMEVPLLKGGRERAKAKRQSFSAYIASLIETDILKSSKRSTPKPQPEAVS